VSPARAVAHLERLREAGMGLRQVTGRTGVARSTLIELSARARISRDTEARILAVSPEPAGGARVSGIGTVRRLQALVAIGWPGAQLAARIGWASNNLWGLILHQQRVNLATARLVADLYEELWDQPGPSVRARSLAARNGWAPPMAWDDEDLDDPATQPQQPEDLRRGRGGARPAQYVVEDWDDTFDHHQGDLELAAARLRMNSETLRTALLRARRRGLEPRGFEAERRPA
jgi:hypothetical protein